MALIVKGGTSSHSSHFMGKTVRGMGLALVVVLVSASCSQHYCPTYASNTYNKSFTYKPTKELSYKPVKVHEFKNTKLTKSDKKGKSKAQLR